MQTSLIQRYRTPARFGAVCSVAMIVGLSGCVETPPTRLDQTPADQSIGPLETPVTVDSNVGTCYARDTTPAIIETVTEQIMVQPAVVRSDGSVEQPAAFRTVTRQRILRERREVEFETPCDHVQTPEFIASVQRALVARGYHRGTINGTMDARTISAIERFQADQNDVHTGVLTLKTAYALGLVALPRDQL